MAEARAALAKAGFAGGRHGGFRAAPASKTPNGGQSSAASGRSSGFGRDRSSPGAAPGGGFAVEDDEDDSMSDFEFDAGGETGGQARRRNAGTRATDKYTSATRRDDGGLTGWGDGDDGGVAASGGLGVGLDGGAPVPPSSAAGLGDDDDDDDDDDSIEMDVGGLGVAIEPAGRSSGGSSYGMGGAAHGRKRAGASHGGAGGRIESADSPVEEFTLEASDSFGSSDARPLSPGTLRRQAAARVAARRGIVSGVGVGVGASGNNTKDTGSMVR